jgi:hypothetical protein
MGTSKKSLRRILTIGVTAILIVGVGAYIYFHQQNRNILPLLYQSDSSASTKRVIPLRPITSTTAKSLYDFIDTKMNLGGNFDASAALCSFKIQGTITDKIAVPGNDMDFDGCKDGCYLDYLKITDSTGYSFFVETRPSDKFSYLPLDSFTIGDKVVVRGQPSGFLCGSAFPNKTMCKDLNVTGFVAELRSIDNFDSNYAEANLPPIEKDTSAESLPTRPAENCITDWQKSYPGT